MATRVRVRVRARHGRGVDEGTHSTQTDTLNPTRVDPMVVQWPPLKSAANTVKTVPNDATGSV